MIQGIFGLFSAISSVKWIIAVGGLVGLGIKGCSTVNKFRKDAYNAGYNECREEYRAAKAADAERRRKAYKDATKDDKKKLDKLKKKPGLENLKKTLDR